MVRNLVVSGPMMKLCVKEVAKAKGFETAQQLADAMSKQFKQRISYATIYPIWDDEAKLWSRATFDKLCAFLDVPAGMLIQYIPGEVKIPTNGQLKRKVKDKK